MNQQDIIMEYRRGDESLAAAKLLAGSRFYNDAMSRAYYAVLHYVRSLLLTEEIIPQSHHGAFVHFAKSFVKTGIMSAEFNRILGRLQKLREEADYMTGVAFGNEEVSFVLENVCAFQSQTHLILESRGILAERAGSDSDKGAE